MICPFCEANDDKVIDSRSTDGGRVIRRRRECLRCERRFTTYERVEQAGRLVVVKRDGSRVPFSPENIIRGVSNACGKRPIAEEVKQRLAEEVEEELHAEFEREVPSPIIGERVMARLRDIDPISYLRFAIEQRELASIDGVLEEVRDLMSRPIAGPNQQGLFVEKAAQAG